MGIGGLFKGIKNIRLLPPADKEFYEIFNELAATLIEASGKLIELFGARSGQREEIEIKISTCALRCDQIAASIEALLRVAQQPPFERSEISQFRDEMLRAMKYISHAANRYIVYDFPSSDKEMRELAPLIYEACVEISKAIKSLARDRDIEPFRLAVNQLEAKADDIYHEGLRRRFREIREDRAELESQIKKMTGETRTEITNRDLINLVADNVEYTRHVAVFFILRQVYAELERAIDACTDIAATLKRMVTSNV